MWNQEIVDSEGYGKVDNSQLFPSWKSGNNNTPVLKHIQMKIF